MKGIVSYGDNSNSTSEQLNPSLRRQLPQLNNPFCGASLTQLDLPMTSPSFEAYLIFIEYTEQNIKIVKENFCNLAYQSLDKKGYIQVAGFVDPKEAESFRALMEEEFGKAEIEKISTQPQISAPHEALSTVRKSVAEAALLTNEQVELLVFRDKNNFKNIEFKVLVPTYVPQGFDVFWIGSSDNEKFGPTVNIIYKNSNNACFSVSSISGGFGAGPGGKETIIVTSPALGEIELGYTRFDQISRGSQIEFQGAPIIRGKQGYSFNSPGGVDGWSYTYIFNRENDCQSISLDEAIKVAESLEYLNDG